MPAYYFHNVSPFFIEFRDGIGLRWYGFAYVLAFLLGYRLYRWLAEHDYAAVPPQNVGDFIIWVAVFGVLLGGRLGYALFCDFNASLSSPGFGRRNTSALSALAFVGRVDRRDESVVSPPAVRVNRLDP